MAGQWNLNDIGKVAKCPEPRPPWELEIANTLSYRALEVAIIGRQVGLVRVDKPIAYLDIDDTGLVEAGYGPQV